METKVIAKSPGMGAVPNENSVTFRVWAPHADRVFVTGTFNNWQEADFALEQEENGYWAGATEDCQPGDEYKYVIHNGEQVLLKNDPYAFEVTNSDGNSVVRRMDFNWEGDDFRMQPWNELVIYELHIGTFNRQKPDKVSTFHDAIRKIPYLKELGINALEILPVAEFAGGISWGYNPAHPFAIEQEYGGPDGFAALVKEAHAHGIGVIIDVVYNHFGPQDVDIWQFDGWSENNKGGIYFYNDHRSTTPWGENRPDYGRPEVRQYIRDNALMWIEKYHCDGIRMDATAFIRYEKGMEAHGEIYEGNLLMRDLNAELQDKYPHVLTIAEDLKGEDKITDDLENNGLGYGSQWDLTFVNPVREVLTAVRDEERDLQTIIDSLLHSYSGDVFRRIIYTESHDEVANGKSRVPEEITPGDAENAFAKKRAILGIALTLTAPGIPMLFQGQEFIEDEYFDDNTGLDWHKLEKFPGIRRLVADLIHLRNGQHDGTRGLCGQNTEVVHFDNTNKVIAFIRSRQEDPQPVLVVLNFSGQDHENYSIGVNQPWNLRINSSWQGYDGDFSPMPVEAMEITEEPLNGQPMSGTMNLPGYAALIYTV